MTELETEDVVIALAVGRDRLSRFLMSYKFAIQEIETKLSILRQEFQQVHRYNPIEHVSSRLKDPQQMIAKARRRGCGPDEESIRENIFDIAGVRVVCSFISDAYRLQQMLCAQDDVELLTLKDYIKNPKPSGYRSLHAIVTVPVFLSDRRIVVPVEIQFRTIAQDFWASLEHKIFYKYDKHVPGQLNSELIQAAETAAELDTKMERLAQELQPQFAESPTPVSEESVRTFLRFIGGNGAGPG